MKNFLEIFLCLFRNFFTRIYTFFNNYIVFKKRTILNIFSEFTYNSSCLNLHLNFKIKYIKSKKIFKSKMKTFLLYAFCRYSRKWLEGNTQR